jgi:hypothetical protein
MSSFRLAVCPGARDGSDISSITGLAQLSSAPGGDRARATAAALLKRIDARHHGAQVPPTHGLPWAHAVPQEPQFCGSTPVFVHLVPQYVRPAGQALQTPNVHCWVPVHVLPHEPQFDSSVLVSTHAPLQSVSAPVHPVAVQFPCKHTEPVAQAVPQLPQLLGSVAVSTHTVPQSCWVPTQPESWQLPPTQAWFPAQAVPQPPQLAESVCVLTQAPPQSVVFAGQSATQLPAAHF